MITIKIKKIKLLKTSSIMRLTKSVIIVLTLVCFNTVKLLSCVNLPTLFLFNILLAIFCSCVYVVQIQLINFHKKNKTEFLL